MYPLFIFLFIKILFKSLNWSKDDNQLNKYLIIIILASFFVIQASASLLFLNEYSYGRGFSDPKVTEGSAYHWLINNWSNNDEIYINDGLQVNYWQKSFFPYIFGLPNRNYPIKNFLYDLKKGTYIVIVPVIQTKGPYRWIELEPILKDINKFDILLNDKEEKIFRVK